jgi:hypothetical protein
MTTSRLHTIATRQRSTRVRDALFAACIALAAAVSISSVGTAAAAASPAPAHTQTLLASR